MSAEVEDFDAWAQVANEFRRIAELADPAVWDRPAAETDAITEAIEEAAARLLRGRGEREIDGATATDVRVLRAGNVRLAAEVERKDEALRGLIRIVEAMRLTTGLGKSQVERLNAARAAIDNFATPPEPAQYPQLAQRAETREAT